MTSAWLAPELPSISGTFVFREIDAIRAAGHDVRTWSLRRPEPQGLSPDGAAHLATTRVVYDGPAAVAVRAARFALRHPMRAATTLAVALRDTVAGRFARRAQRAKVLPQAVAGLALAHSLQADGVAHLHVHFAHAAATVGMYAARASRIPFSLTAHANDLFVEASLLREKARRAAAFVTISEANRTWLRERLGPDADNVHVVRCGVDSASFASVPREPAAGGRIAGAVRLVATGRLVPKKGFDVLVRALPGVVARHPDVLVEIAGDGPEARALADLARRLGVTNHVRFLGSVDRDGVRALLGRATAFVLPCRADASGDRDGIPVALMESMAAGVPAISTRISGVPELVRDGETGVLCEPGDVASLEAAILRVLGDRALARRVAARGAEFVRTEYDLRRNALRLAATVGIG